jgi:hypothetical protein
MRKDVAVLAEPESTVPVQLGARSLALKIGQIIILSIPAVIAFAVLYHQAFSVPYEDDYHAILEFAIRYQQSATWASKILEIVAHQHTEYKLVWDHLIIALELGLTGHLNLEFLITLGNLSLIPIAWLLWSIHRSEDGQGERLPLRFLPVSLLFFSLAYWETLDWAIAGIQNLPVVLFALLSIKLLVSAESDTRTNWRFWTSCLSAVFSTFSLANGFLLAPIGLVILLRRKAYAASAVWCTCFLLALVPYVYRYVPLHREPPTNLARGLFFFAFLGGAFPNPLVAAPMGIALAVVFGLAIRSRYYRTHPASFFFTLWIFVCAALVAWVRGSIASRYSIYSVLLLIFAYKFLSNYLLTRLRLTFWQVFVPFLIFAVGFCISADFTGFRRLGERRRMVLTGMNRYLANPGTNSPMIDPAVLRLFPGEADIERIELSDAIRSHLIATPTSTLQNIR